MQITISMLTDALTDISLSQIQIQKRDTISSMRIRRDGQRMEPGILYLSAGEDPQKTVCQTAAQSSFAAASDLPDVLNHIMQVFDFYNDWQKQLDDAVASGCTLTDLLNLSAPVLRHPLSILDANEWEIAHSENFSKLDMDADWNDMIRTHTSNPGKIAAFNEKYYKYFNLHQVYRIPGNIFGDGYACNLFHHQTFCGVMIMANAHELPDITPGERDAMQYLCDLICTMISIDSYSADIQFPEKPLLEYISEKDAASLQKLERSLEISAWKSSDPKWFLFSEPLKSGSLAPMPSHSKLMFHRMEGLVTVEYQTGLLFLCNLRILGGRAAAQSFLSRYLQQISYHAGSSSEFTDLSASEQMLDQAQLALKYSAQSSGHINLFENAMLPYLVSMLKKIDNGRIAHPCLQQLKDYDKRSGNKLYETLFSYLKNERKLSATMQDLDIPRSTLLNRLQRIDELLDVSLENPGERLYLLLSYLIANDTKPIGIN